MTPDFLRGLLACELESGGHILERLCVVELLKEGHAFLCVGTVVGEFNATLDAVKESRGYGEKAVMRISVGDGTDMFVDAENFLDDDKAGDGFACGTRYVGIQFMAVSGFQFYGFAHGAASSVL